jgi:hypothetical protein
MNNPNRVSILGVRGVLSSMADMGMENRELNHISINWV